MPIADKIDHPAPLWSHPFDEARHVVRSRRRCENDGLPARLAGFHQAIGRDDLSELEDTCGSSGVHTALGARYELDERELIEMLPAEWRHSCCEATII